VGAIDLLSRVAGAMTLPGGRGGRLTLLLYHRVMAQPDLMRPEDLDSGLFEIHMRAISRTFRVLGLDEAIMRLRDGTLPARALCITFDDGYRDNYEFACPVLRKYGLTATFFIASGFLGEGRMFHDTIVESIRRIPPSGLDLSWLGLGLRTARDTAALATLANDIVATVKYMPPDAQAEACERLESMASGPLPQDLMMTPEQVRALPGLGMSVGAHTHNHPILSRIAPSAALSEIQTNRNVLTSLMGSVPTFFAYPNGKPGLDYGAEHVAMVKQAGFSGAVSVAEGSVTDATDPFQLPRFVPWDRDGTRLTLRLLTNPIRQRAGHRNQVKVI
jgi:peptidoglycan/xylan/chitin deacetylase (PgdA/CDA1 family)